MSPRPRGMDARGARQSLLILAVLAVVMGGVLVAFALTTRHSAPPAPTSSAYGRIEPRQTSQPHSPIDRVADEPGVSSSGVTRKSRPAPPSSRSSIPVSIGIAAIGVHSAVISLGTTADGSLAVPQQGPNLNKVAWYRGSPTPGAAGPAVLEGHVDTVQGPSVFYRLGALHPSDKITIHRRDGSTAVFTVNAVRAYSTHADFPAAQIFGGDLSAPTLRLITCSNFDSSIGHYLGNTVVFAHLTSLLPR